MVALIAPSILSADFMHLGDEITKVKESGADLLHLDIMDGHFVPNITVGPEIVRQIRSTTDMTLDVHLMIDEPDAYIADFIEAGADSLTVHVEAAHHLHRTIQTIKERGKKTAVSLNPATPLSSLDYILDDVDMVLIMSVNPGFGGQAFIPQVKEKIRHLKNMLRERNLQVKIEVDGGIKLSNAREIAESGADILVMGSGFFSSDSYADTVRRFRDIVGA